MCVGVGVGVQTGKDTEPHPVLSVPGSIRKEQVSSSEILGLREGQKPWAGAQLTIHSALGLFPPRTSDQEP